MTTATYCEFCDATPCECTALTLSVPSIDADLSNREIEPDVYDMRGAREAVVGEYLRLKGYFRWGHDAWIHEADEGTVMTSEDALTQTGCAR